MSRLAGLFLALFVLPAAIAAAAVLKPETVTAWEQYLAAVDESMRNAPVAGGEFLLLDNEPSRLKEVRQGKIVVWQIKKDNAQTVPHGLIHDWMGAVFVPKATLADVFAVTRGYDKYAQWYGPTIAQGTLIERRGDEDVFTVRYVRHVLFVTAVLETDYDARYIQINATRGYSTARSTRMQEIDHYSQEGERKLPPDDGSGYLWRVYTLTRYEERDEGVYIEQESIGLSRPIPVSLKWVVEPVVKRLAKDLLYRSLEQTRAAVAPGAQK